MFGLLEMVEPKVTVAVVTDMLPASTRSLLEVLQNQALSLGMEKSVHLQWLSHIQVEPTQIKKSLQLISTMNAPRDTQGLQPQHLWLLGLLLLPWKLTPR